MNDQTCNNEFWPPILFDDNGVFFIYTSESNSIYKCHSESNYKIKIFWRWRVKKSDLLLLDPSGKDCALSLTVNASAKCIGSEAVICLWSPGIRNPAWSSIISKKITIKNTDLETHWYESLSSTDKNFIQGKPTNSTFLYSRSPYELNQV